MDIFTAHRVLPQAGQVNLWKRDRSGSLLKSSDHGHNNDGRDDEINSIGFFMPGS
ncbi:MAG: hypothetical protein A4E35_01602 [Methanoregula sp. PtaU1.Bin051]|nr:MAG: hypothetical protein A4E35_01602 [Methanoregula sp. PtaU1.Bin051]